MTFANRLTVLMPLFPLHRAGSTREADLPLGTKTVLQHCYEETVAHLNPARVLFVTEEGHAADTPEWLHATGPVDHAQVTCPNRAAQIPQPVSRRLGPMLHQVHQKHDLSTSTMAIRSPFCIFGDTRELADAMHRFARDPAQPVLATCQPASPEPWKLLILQGEKSKVAKIGYQGAWTYDRQTGHFFDADQRQIYRRQDFKPVYELNYGLIIGRWEQLARFAAAFADVEVAPFVCKRTIMLRTGLDNYRVRLMLAKKRACRRRR